MTGHCRKLLLLALFTGSVGCNRFMVRDSQSPEIAPHPDEPPGLIGSAFGNNSKFPKAPNDPKPAILAKRSSSNGIKPETAVALADTEVEAAFQPGRTAIERDHMLDSARQKYQYALKEDPKNKAALIGLAKMYARTKDHQRATDTLWSAARTFNEDHEIWHSLAIIEARFENWSASTEACRKALQLDPENRTYTKTLGYALARQDRWDEAMEAFHMVMPEAQAHYFVSRILFDLGREEEGRQQLEHSLRLDPEQEAAQTFYAKLNSNSQPGETVTGNEGIRTVGHEQPVP